MFSISSGRGGRGISRRALAAVTVPAAALALASVAAGPAHAQSGSQTIAVPAYFAATSSYWTQLEQSAPSGTIAVANPGNGPGAGFDQNYADTISAAAQAGIRVIGYVDTGYFGSSGRTTRSGQTSASAWTSQVEQDIADWYSWYGGDGLAGIFFDDAESTCGTDNANVDLYIAVNDYAKQNYGNVLTVDNPGGPADQCYASAADELVMFEGDYSDYMNWTAPAWETGSSNPGEFWNLVYDTPTQADMESAVAHSKSENAGNIYVTNDVLDNPWDTLPTGGYWSDEVSQAGSTGGGGGGSGCVSDAGSGDITNYSVCESGGNAVFQATFNASGSFHHVFIDSDGNSATGYAVPSANPIGADYMIENDTLYVSTCTCWLWNEVSGVNPNMTANGGTYTWTVPLSALSGLSVSPQAEFNINSSYSSPLTFSGS